MAEVLVEGFSRVKRCTNEGRALMSLDLQVSSLPWGSARVVPPSFRLLPLSWDPAPVPLLALLQGIVMGIQAVSGSPPSMQLVENYIKVRERTPHPLLLCPPHA